MFFIVINWINRRKRRKKEKRDFLKSRCGSRTSSKKSSISKAREKITAI
jgi:hypothetical protein